MGKGGKIESPKSAYNPGLSVQLLTQDVKAAYEDGDNTLQTSYEEYNNKSFVTQENEARRRWLSHPDAPYEGEDEWRYNGVRPITRNKAVSMAAHLTSQLIYPKTFAQNDQQEEDKNAAYCMDALVEYHIKNSQYETAFLFGVISALVSPLNYFQSEYCESYSNAWSGEKYERVIDDVFSGFQHHVIPMDEMLFSNPYVYEWQKQDWVIRRKRVSYEEMEAKFGKHTNWRHVQIGKMTMVHDDGFFYDVEDINDGLVGYVNYKHRRSDLEIDHVNGVYLSNENTEYNPFYHRTNKDKPEYDTVKFGFEPIDAMRFVGYKSLVDKMENDQDAMDREWQDYFDATRLATFPPTITMGAGKIDKSVAAPAGITEIGKSAKVTQLQVANPIAAGAGLREAERAAAESSVDPIFSGQQEGPEKTKFETMLLQQNSSTNLGITARMIATMVRDVGRIHVHDIARFETVGHAGEIAGEMVYKMFALDGRVREGRGVTTYVKFTDRYAGTSMSDEEKRMEEYGLLEEAGDDKELIVANPAVISKLGYRVSTDPEQLMNRNSAFERAFKISAYDRAIINPLVAKDPEAQLAITRDFLFEPIMRGDASKYLPNLRRIAESLAPAPGAGAPGGYPQPGRKAPQDVAGGAVV